MSYLWVDKYRPKTLSELSHSYDITAKLENLSSATSNINNIPNILVYGPNGAGKKTRIMALLNRIYCQDSNQIYKLKIDVRQFKINSKSLELNVISSPYHIEITPSDLGFSNDKIVIQELIKELGSTSHQFTPTSSSTTGETQHVRFKTIVINDANKLSKAAQHALRRTIEKYSKNIRIIMCCETLSNIIDPIRSRMLNVRLSAPSQPEFQNIVKDVSLKESVTMGDIFINKLSVLCRGNIRLGLLTLENMAVLKNMDLSGADINVIKPDWMVCIDKICLLTLKNKTVDTVLTIRGIFYDLLAHCIPAELILQKIVEWILENAELVKLRQDKITTVIYYASIFDERLKLGSKDIFHLEGFITKMILEI
ncbi:hypothetical protein QEN19_003758 [Hanseniaspora menglaensis]